MAILPYIPLGLDIFDRVYKIIKGVRGKAKPAKNEELLALQEDVTLLKNAIELQTEAFSRREANLSDCVDTLERQVRSLKVQVWVLGLVLIATIATFGWRI